MIRKQHTIEYCAYQKLRQRLLLATDFYQGIKPMVQPKIAPNTITLATVIVASYSAKNKLTQQELPKLLTEVHQAITGIENGANHFRGGQKPAVPISKSITDKYLICLEDGKKLKMLKRYLRTHFNMTPEEYRSKWDLSADYPMVAPGYSKRRSKLAKEAGLGTKPASRKRPSKKAAGRKKGQKVGRRSTQ